MCRICFLASKGAFTLSSQVPEPTHMKFKTSLQFADKFAEVDRALREATNLLLDCKVRKESLRTLHLYLVAVALQRHHGNKCRAARELGIHRNTMGRQIEELQLQPLVDQLRKTPTPQLKLFTSPVRKSPARAMLAQASTVFGGNSQGESNAFPQL